MLLAIDTATRVMTLALHDKTDLLAEQTWHTRNHHSVELAPAVRLMLERCDVLVTDLTALAVSIGPGSYTGLRIGVALAKGIAAANNLPLVGVSTLDILAAGQPCYASKHGLIVVIQAGRGRIIVQTYHWRRERWLGKTEPQLMDWDTLLERIDAPAYLTGEISTAGHEALVTARARNIPVKLAPSAYRLRRGGFLAQVAWEQLQNAEKSFKAEQVVPFYVKTRNSP